MKRAPSLGNGAKRPRRTRPDKLGDLRARLREAEEMLLAFSRGEVDAVLRSGPSGDRVYTLQGADHVYRVMVETMSEGAVTLSPAGLILYANRRFADLVMTGLDNVMGRALQDFLPAAEHAALADLLQRSEQEDPRCLFELLRSSGGSVPVYIAVRRLEADGFPCLVAIVTDLSALRRSEADLHRADEQFRLAMEAVPTGILLLDLAGCIVRANAQIEMMFGYPRAELLGTDFRGLLPERFRANQPDLRALFSNAAPVPSSDKGVELYGLRKDGAELPMEMVLTPLQTSAGELILASLVDLSPRQEVDRLRTDFVAMVSHELRTPLTAISASLGLLDAGTMGALPNAAASMVRLAHRNSARLERIINDILDVGSLEAGKSSMLVTSEPLIALLQQSIEASAGYAQMCNVRFDLEGGSPDHRVMVDPHRLVQVLTNLLSNAAKFSPPGAEVIIRVHPPGATTIRVEVEDAGPGIPKSFQGRVFDKFSQADSTPARRFEGSGLGLSIARKLMIAMGGHIGFKTAIDRGTVFFLEVPRADTAAAALKAAAPASNGSSPSLT